MSPGSCNDQQLFWRKNSGDSEWRTTGAAESTGRAGKLLGIAPGD